MKRNDFLKMLGGGVAGAALVPQVLKAKPVTNSENGRKYPAVAVDFATISNFTAGGKKISPWEIMEHYDKTGFLIYRSIPGHKPPIVLSGELEIVKH